MRGRRVALVLALAVSVSLAVGASGFSALSADRTISVAVADDEEAFLALDVPSELEFDNGRHDGVVIIEFVGNNFPEPLELNITISDPRGSPVKLDQETPDTLGSGETATVTVDLECSAGQEREDWDVDIVADGKTVHVELTRTVTIICTGEPDRSQTATSSQ